MFYASVRKGGERGGGGGRPEKYITTMPKKVDLVMAGLSSSSIAEAVEVFAAEAEALSNLTSSTFSSPAPTLGSLCGC